MADDKAKLRADFEQLQREYKNMEAMRKAYSEESLGIIRRQRDMIEKLQKDVESLKGEIDLETRFSQRKSQSDDAMSSLREQIELYKTKVDVEKRNIEQLSKQISVMKKKILEQRKSMGGVNAAKDNQAMVNKQIRVLENRLDKALVKFNEALATNKDLRKQIDDLRQERVVFDNIYKKLEKSLVTKKKSMAAIIEASNEAYEARDSAQMEIAALQHSMNRERQEFEEAMLSLTRQIESSEGSVKRAGDGVDTTTAEERDLRTSLSKGTTAVERERATMLATRDKVASYEEGFNKIRAATGISNIEELVATFIQNEDQNFSLFNYVAEQNNEMERLEEQIASLKAEAAKHSMESGEDIHQHKQLLTDLETRLQASNEAVEKYDARFSEASHTLDALMGGIQSLFNRLGCNEKAISELLADNTVTENNMMQFLGVIEQRTNEILRKLASKQKDKLEESMGSATGGVPAAVSPVAATSSSPVGEPDPASTTLVSLLGHGPTIRHGSEALVAVEPPKVDDYTDDDESVEDDAHPLSLKELKEKTVRTHSRGGPGDSRRRR